MQNIRNTTIILIILVFGQQSLYAQNFDIDMVRNAQSHRTPTLDNIMKGISDSEFLLLPAVPIGILVGGIMAKDTHLVRSSVQTAVGIGLAGALAFGIKEIAKRPRPFVTYNDIDNLDDEKGYSMPSAHTSFAFSLATSLTLQYKNMYVSIPAYLWAAAVGYSRIYLGAHYPSDVLVGILVGVASAFITYELEKIISKKK